MLALEALSAAAVCAGFGLVGGGSAGGTRVHAVILGNSCAKLDTPAPFEAKKAQKPARNPVNKAAISLVEARDGDLSKSAHRALAALTVLAGERDTVDVSDETLAALMSSDRGVVAPTSVRGLLAGLEDHGYLSLDRKRKGQSERHITLCNPYTRGQEIQGQEIQGQEIQGQEIQGQENSENAAEICTELVQIPEPTKRKKRVKKETPNRHKRESLNQESLDSLKTLESLTPGPLTADLTELAAQYGTGHYHPDVVEAADYLGDLDGLPHYANAHRFLAQGDQDVWAEAVERTITYFRGGRGGVESPRRYLETCIGDVLESQAKRDRLLGPRPGPAPPEPEAPPVRACGLPEAIWDIMGDPFADDIAGDAGPGDVAEPKTADDVPPGQGDVADPEPVPVLPVFVPHTAVLEAVQSLGLQVAVEDVQVVFEGACRGREALFALVVSAMTGIAVQSPIAFMCRVADKHKGKDDAYLLDRASGMTAAERTARLKEFEAWLEDQKQALNPPLTPCGGFRSETHQGLAPLLDGIMGQATKTASPCVPSYLASVTLPSTPQGWAALEETLGQMRDAFRGADPRLRGEADVAGTALAHARAVQAEQPTLWDQWRRVGVYHAFEALRQAGVRAEAVRQAEAAQRRAEAEAGSDW